VIVGSSLSVYPAAYLPVFARQFIIINLSRTGFDYWAKLVINEKASSALVGIYAGLKRIESTEQ